MTKVTNDNIRRLDKKILMHLFKFYSVSVQEGVSFLYLLLFCREVGGGRQGGHSLARGGPGPHVATPLLRRNVPLSVIIKEKT